jgi:hypothetical protein
LSGVKSQENSILLKADLEDLLFLLGRRKEDATFAKAKVIIK